MIDAPTEKKPKTAMFKNSSTFGKKDDDANNTIPSSDEAHDGDDKKAKGLGVVSFESDSENGTEERTVVAGTENGGVAGMTAFNNCPWTSLLCNETLNPYEQFKPMDIRDGREAPKLRTLMNSMSEPRSNTAAFHPLFESREGSPPYSRKGEFEDGYPPASFLLRQNSLFSPRTLNDSSAATLFNFNSTNPPDFSIEDLKPPTPPYIPSNEKQGIFEQSIPKRGEWHNHEFAVTTHGESQQSEHDRLRALNIDPRKLVNTPHGPAILLSSIDSTQLQMMMPPTMMPLDTTSNRDRKFKRWSDEEDDMLRYAMSKEGPPPYNWKKIARKYFANSRSSVQCKSRWTKSLQPGVVRGSWQQHEDDVITEMRSNGMKWAAIAELLPGRIGEHVRDRYVNFLDPSLKRTPWTTKEDGILFREQRRIGNKWTEISQFLPGRSENAVKNRWHNAKMTQRRKLRREANELSRIEQSKRARSHEVVEGSDADEASFSTGVVGL